MVFTDASTSEQMLPANSSLEEFRPVPPPQLVDLHKTVNGDKTLRPSKTLGPYTNTWSYDMYIHIIDMYF